MDVDILFRFVAFFFPCLVISSAVQMLFDDSSSQLLTLGLIFWANGRMSRKCFYRVLPKFYSSSFRVSGFKMRALIHLYPIFVRDDGQGSHFICLHGNSQCSQHYLLKMLHLLQNMCFALCQMSDDCSDEYSCLDLYWSTCAFCDSAISFLLI